MIVGTRLAILTFLLMIPFGAAAMEEAQRPLDAALRKAFEAGELSGLHSVLIRHKGEIAAEVYFEGKDERWGTPLGVKSHGAETLHDLRSVTKSVVGLLYGIALGEGKVPGIDESLVAQFPHYEDLQSDNDRKGIEIRHALSMTMGTEWNEDLPYTDPRNSEIAMELADDRYRFVLDRPMVETPGASWDYNGGATAIIAKLIANGTGMPLDEYAKEKLFEPLGISDFEWIGGSDGEPSAASGLRLTTHDLAKIGQLVLDNGRFAGKQIVPEDWLEAALAPQTDTGQGLQYGYFWWLPGKDSPFSWAAGFGNGGQRLTVYERANLVLVVFAGNYNKPDAWELPVKVITDFMVPILFPDN